MGKTYKIAVIPGDATGPATVKEAQKVLKVASERYGFKLEFTEYPFGGNYYRKTGELIPDSAMEELRQSSGILFGAIGHPDVKPGILEHGILLRIRQELDQYIYLRPIKLLPGIIHPLRGKRPEDIDFIVVRENTAGLYAGINGTTAPGTPHETAIETMVYSRPQVDRCLDYAFQLAQRRRRKSLDLVGKSSVLTHVYGLWERCFNEMGEQFDDVKRSYHHIDEMCMRMIRKPESLDVVVSGNIFGDILGDLAASLQGGVGYAAGGNINPEGVSMFGPVGGDFTADVSVGTNVNPIAAISAGEMLLHVLGEHEAANRVEQAIMFVAGAKIAGGDPGVMGFTTQDVGDMVCESV